MTTRRRGTDEGIPPDFFLAGYPDEIRVTAEGLRAIVKGAVPDVLERVRPGWKIIGYDLPIGRRTVYFAWVMPETVHVISGFRTVSSWPIRTGGSKAPTFDCARPGS